VAAPGVTLLLPLEVVAAVAVVAVAMEEAAVETNHAPKNPFMKINVFRIYLTAIVLLNFFGVQAQNYAESALLFSRTRPGGSARIQGIGGAQIALGGDYSSALSNPAGLGMYNRSEFTFTPAITSNTTSATYLGNSTSDNRSVFNIPGFSFVWNMPKEKGGFLGGSFGVSLSRVNDFNSSTVYSGHNNDNSIVDYFIDQANGSTTAQFDEGASQYNTPTGLAYFNYLIGAQSILNPPGPNNRYFTDVGYPDQKEEIQIQGANNQWSFSYGGNIQDKLFFGAGIGITSLKYKSRKIFTENYDNPDTIQFMQLNENLDIHGTGLNATFGALVRPVDFIQIGASFTTPTFYGLSETYEATMGTRWSNFDYYGDKTKILKDNTNNPIGTDVVTSSYNLTTPLKFSAGIAFLSKFGFITGDIEMTNPSKAKYSSNTTGVSYNGDNNDIRSSYQGVMNYRLGAEFRYQLFRIRAGYGIQANTYKDALEANNQITSFSGGFGVRTDKFHADFALINSSSKKYFYQPYTFSDGSGPVVDLKNRVTTGMITVGFMF
jgi:hypothetical protein